MLAEFPKTPPNVHNSVFTALESKRLKMTGPEHTLSVDQRIWTIYGLASESTRDFIDAVFIALADKPLESLLQYPDEPKDSAQARSPSQAVLVTGLLRLLEMQLLTQP
jgi:hypothetical protein